MDEGFSEEQQSSFAWNTGVDVRILKGLKVEPGKYWFKVYFGGEVGSYYSEYTEVDWKNETDYSVDAFYWGGRFTAVLFNFLMVRYALGNDDKSISSYDSSVDDLEYAMDYTKWGFGIQIHF